MVGSLGADDRERLARFQREAEVLASLNHQHIAHVYGIEDPSTGSGQAALVMELVEGEDLSQRIARVPIPIDEALTIARQIAEALEAAHFGVTRDGARFLVGVPPPEKETVTGIRVIVDGIAALSRGSQP